jgi:hypothetical protein
MADDDYGENSIEDSESARGDTFTLISYHKDTQAKISMLGVQLDEINRKLSWLIDPPPITSVSKTKEFLQNDNTILTNIGSKNKSKKYITVIFLVLCTIILVGLAIFLSRSNIFSKPLDFIS